MSTKSLKLKPVEYLSQILNPEPLLASGGLVSNVDVYPNWIPTYSNYSSINTTINSSIADNGCPDFMIVGYL